MPKAAKKAAPPDQPARDNCWVGARPTCRKRQYIDREGRRRRENGAKSCSDAAARPGRPRPPPCQARLGKSTRLCTHGGGNWGLLFGGSWGETRGGASAPPQRVPSEPRGPPEAALKGSARRPSDPLRVPRGALKRAPSDPAPTLRRLQEPLVCCGLHRTQVLPKSVERDFQAHKQDARGSNIEKPHPAAQTALQKQNCLS